MREYIAPFGIGLAYPKYVPYIAKFNTIIRKLTEAGLAKKWLADIIIKSKQAKITRRNKQEGDPGASDESEEASQFRPLTMDNLQGGFILLLLGYGLSTLGLMAELTFKVILGHCIG
ncbi:uncharacterized protein LOC121856262 [Homarus americanus]|uniref:uncharacterized protein LOC121856262 n=1 Tax=Homarus americanus TaxID=6706 RepID=UPI001C470241|nr:uncharacterized protein LOC121856262 [Homarus americanus]